MQSCAAYRGYILGGLMWFAVPFTLATTLGLTGLALDLPLSAKEVSSGLVPPAVAYHLFGKGGVILVTIMVFMAGVPYYPAKNFLSCYTLDPACSFG